MRRTAEWAQRSVVAESSSQRIAALRQIDVWATGQVLAGTLVPSRMYIEAIIWTIFVPGLVFTTALAPPGYALLVTAGGFITLALTFPKSLRVHAERYRIKSQYFKGEEVIPPTMAMLGQTSHSSRAELLTSTILSAGVCSLSLGVTRIVLVNGFTAELPDLLLVIVGGGVLLATLSRISAKHPSLIHADWAGRPDLQQDH